MHVSEEIDALETMGISPIPFLVLPRIVALVIVAPMLVLIGDVAAVSAAWSSRSVTLEHHAAGLHQRASHDRRRVGRVDRRS